MTKTRRNAADAAVLAKRRTKSVATNRLAHNRRIHPPGLNLRRRGCGPKVSLGADRSSAIEHRPDSSASRLTRNWTGDRAWLRGRPIRRERRGRVNPKFADAHGQGLACATARSMRQGRQWRGPHRRTPSGIRGSQRTRRQLRQRAWRMRRRRGAEIATMERVAQRGLEITPDPLKPLSHEGLWCRRWDSNPHAFKGGGF